GRRRLTAKERRQLMPKKRFAAYTGKQRTAQREQFSLPGQKSIILPKAFAEPITGIEDHRFRRDAGSDGSLQTLSKSVANHCEQCIGIELRLCPPFIGAPARMR